MVKTANKLSSTQHSPCPNQSIAATSSRPPPPPARPWPCTAASSRPRLRRQRAHRRRLPRRRRPLPAAHRRHPRDAARREEASPPSPSATSGTATRSSAASKGRGLYPSAKRCGLDADDKKHVTKDYRRLLDRQGRRRRLHRHARPLARQDVHRRHGRRQGRLLRKADDPHDRRGPAPSSMPPQKNNRVMTVGVQSMADPTWRMAYELIPAGKIGHVVQGQTSYYRNSIVGQWRYYPLTKDMTPKTIDWKMFLGHRVRCAGEKLGPTQGAAVRPRRLASGAATGTSAAACSPTCSSTRPPT